MEESQRKIRVHLFITKCVSQRKEEMKKFTYVLCVFFVAFYSYQSQALDDPSEVEDMLLISAYEGDINKVKDLLAKGVDVNAMGENGETPLLAAVNSGKIDMTALLLSYGANIEARNFQNSTPLIIASQYGHSAITAMLLELGAKMNVRDFLERVFLSCICTQLVFPVPVQDEVFVHH